MKYNFSSLKSAIAISVFGLASQVCLADGDGHGHHSKDVFEKGWSKEHSHEVVEQMYIEKYAKRGSAALQKKSTQWYRNMTEQELMDIALEAGPPHLTKDASIMIPTKDMVYVTVREGTNAITCIPKANFLIPMWDPACSDPAGHEWLMSLQREDPAPSNVVPGTTYMFRGAGHWQLPDGSITPGPGPDAVLMEDPGHWMLLYPFDGSISGFPEYPNPGSVNLIYSGTPYSTLVFTMDTLCFSGISWVGCNPPRGEGEAHGH